MTNTEVPKTDSPREGRRGLVYCVGDRWAWEPQIRAIQEWTFAADGVPVEHHERQVAFHRAVTEVDDFIAEAERRASKGSSTSTGVYESAVISTAVREARRVSGYKSRWFYIAAAISIAATAALTALLLVTPNWFVQRVLVDLLLLDLPPRLEHLGGEGLDRVLNYGMWGVTCLGVFMLMLPLFDIVLLAYEFCTRRRLHKINELVLSAAVGSARAYFVCALSLSVLVIVVIAAQWPIP